MARVLLENLTKVFDGGVAAVADFSLDIADNEFMVIVGPSGCGKTTTLRMIAGLEKPTSGNIYIGQTLVNDIRPRDRDIAMVFQNYALYPHMTVYQNMAFALKMRKAPKPEIRKRVEQAASLLGIQHLLDRKPTALSGGQCQRVALGRAIVRHPAVFLFDEPLSNLDAKLRIATRAELKALHNRLQTTSIYVTHDQAEAMSLGDRICVMHNGTVQQVGAPRQVYDQPVNRFVAGFIGTPPMNFLAGHLEFKNDTVRFCVGSEAITLPPRSKATLSNYRGRDVELGVRAEHLSLHPFRGQTDNTICATVSVVESLGPRTDVYLALPGGGHGVGTNFIASIAANNKLRAGDTLKIYIDLEKIHIFEPAEFGKNLTLC